MKYKGLREEILALAILYNGDAQRLYSDYEFFKVGYPGLIYSTYNRLVRKACAELREQGYDFSQDKDKKKSKKKYTYHPELKEWITQRLIENNMNKFTVYNMFSEIKDNYTSSRESFERMVRYVHNKIVDQQIQRNDNINYVGEQKMNVNKIIFLQDDLDQMEFKRMVILSDLHCGHVMGLTPPTWQFNQDNSSRGEIARVQKEAWNWYTQAVQHVGKNIDILVVNGDLIDGRGERSGSTELITTCRIQQGNIAIEALSQWNPDQVFITRGTPYHTGQAEQFEDLIADKLNAHIEDVLDLRVHGKTFNFRHKIGSSSVPYGKATQVIKEAIWNALYAIYHEIPSADVIIRSHVHHMVINRDGSRWSITTPALQVNSRYGKQQCNGITDFGFLVVDIYENGHIIVNPYLAKLETQHSEIIEID